MSRCFGGRSRCLIIVIHAHMHRDVSPRQPDENTAARSKHSVRRVLSWLEDCPHGWNAVLYRTAAPPDVICGLFASSATKACCRQLRQGTKQQRAVHNSTHQSLIYKRRKESHKLPRAPCAAEAAIRQPECSAGFGYALYSTRRPCLVAQHAAVYVKAVSPQGG